MCDIIIEGLMPKTHRNDAQQAECRLWTEQKYETEYYRANKCAYSRFAG